MRPRSLLSDRRLRPVIRPPARRRLGCFDYDHGAVTPARLLPRPPAAACGATRCSPRSSSSTAPAASADALRRFDHFAMLVRAIVFQQLSTKAATTIHGRLVALLPDGRVTPAGARARSPTSSSGTPASAGRRPMLPARSVREGVAGGVVALEALDAMTDEEVIAALTQVKGIGRWTAEMFLIFRLQRPDVLPLGDLGIVNAIQKAYGLRKKPTPDACASSAKPGGRIARSRAGICGEAWTTNRRRSLPPRKPQNPPRKDKKSHHMMTRRTCSCIGLRRSCSVRPPVRSRQARGQEVGRRRRLRPGRRSWRSTRAKARG